MESTIRSVSVIVLSLASGAASASPRILDFTYTGTVATIADTSGVFGAGAAAGDPFTLVFRLDTAKGQYFAGGGGTGDGSGYEGGTRFAGQPAPGSAVSPVSATLTIDGHALGFDGRYDGLTEEFNSFFGNPGQGISGEEQTAQDQTSNGRATLADVASASVGTTYPVPFPTIDTPFSIAIDGTRVMGRASFDYASTNAAGLVTLQTSGTLTPTEFTVSPDAAPVGEPGATLPMLAALIGSARITRTLRRRWAV